MRGFLKNILTLVFYVLFIHAVCYGEEVYTGNFRQTKNLYSTPVGETFHITGNLTVPPGYTFVVGENSTLIVDGDLILGESGNTNESELQLSVDSKVLIKGNAYFGGGSFFGWGWIPHMAEISGSGAEVVIQGNVTSWKSKSVSIGDNTVYVFGSGGDIVSGKNETQFAEEYDNIDKFLSEIYPKCYNLKKENGSDFGICTDIDGDIVIDLDDIKYDNTTLLTIPENLKIECRNFTIKGDGYRNNTSNTGILCEGVIECTGDFRIENLGYMTSSGRPYFKTECSSSILAKNIYVNYNYTIQPFSGNWVTNSLIVENGQGQDINFPECSYIKTTETIINANISNGVKIEGHVVSEKLQATKNINLVYNGTAQNKAILTVGSLDGVHSWDNIKIIADENTVLNLCSNPTEGDGSLENEGQWNQQPKGADKIGYFSGFVLYNFGEHGWPLDNWGPEEEWDINVNDNSGTYWNWKNSGKAPIVKKAYSSYKNCIDEVNMASFLPIELVSFSFDKARNEFVWTTASETNNDYFVVEYSKNGRDWIECTEYVQSQSDNGYTYGTEPIMPVNESLFSYFRLKQVDLNGEFSYSDVITISFTVENPCSEEYEDSKMQIREFGNRYYRLINGELIYCENDNE